MAYNNDQEDIALPQGDDKASSSAFLPKFFRTDTNKKFISSTLDQLVTPGVLEKLNSFAGRRYSSVAQFNDSYLSDISTDRENYQFEPVSVYKDELGNVEFLKDYNDYIGQINAFKGDVKNHSVLNRQEFYSWNPHVDWDKFVNFREYYWLPFGPEPIGIAGQAKAVQSTYTVTLSDEQDNYTYVFTPNGFTKNPTLKLYRGQTYRFEINAPGHPMAFAISRSFIDLNPTEEVDGQILSTLWTLGITKYTYNAEGKLVETTDDYIENGVIEFTVPDTSDDTLYYISKNDINTGGLVTLYNIAENSEIDVTEEIIGKKTYRTESGIDLSNGMKVYFQGLVTPAEYDTGYYYVEGVGSKIKLIAESDLEVPSVFTSVISIPFDGYAFDQYPFEDGTAFPGTKDYIVINRASADRNAWTRYNRWFHKSVIEASAAANNLELSLDQDARAKRPIIEFEAGLKLYKHGSKAKKNVTLVDDFTDDVFSTIEGSLGYNIDGIDLVDGMRLLVTADTDILVNGKVYDVNFITHNGRRQISLVEAEDSDPAENDTILILDGTNNKGKMFYYANGIWNVAQNKTDVNETPLFDLFDKDGNSYSDEIIYPASSFVGNKIFSYKVGSGTADTELGFALSYRNIANVGDIVFDFNMLSDSFTYQDLFHSSITSNTDIGFVKIYNESGETFTWENGWKKAVAQSVQPVIRQYNISTKFNNFAIDVFNSSGTLTDLYVKVYVNGKKIESTNYTVTNVNGMATLIFNNALVANDILVIKCYSSADKNSNGFYEIPINLEKNPLNENITTFTLGQVNDHVLSIVENHPNFSGEFLGINNLRDLGNVTAYGNRFVQHSGPINLASYHITDKNANVVKALKFARREYAKFKRRFLNAANETGFHGSAKDHVDLIISKLATSNLSYNSWYFSDMIGFGAAKKTIHTIEYSGPAYLLLSQSYDITALSTRAIGVYLNNELLMYTRDYTISNNFVYVTANLQPDDIVEVYEYNSTNGSYIPPTPTKLGLYPKYQPMITTDNTYTETQQVIQGHDGSITIAFGDYRDELLLELETRIYNNLKVDYDTTMIDIHDFVGGAYRDTGISKEEIDNVLLADFSNWLELAGSPDYSNNDFWDQLNGFTYNYSLMSDREGINLKGYWRSVYKKYYDTDRPHTHPWEMLGFTIKPTWWESVYGPAPYTKDNLILWQDLEEGIVRDPSTLVRRNKKYARPGLVNNIPVNEYGQLVSPVDAGLAQDFNLINSRYPFAFGDHSPVETAWRRSSEYPFALITAWCLLQPAKILGLGLDRSRIQRDITGNIVYTPTQKRIQLADIVFPSIEKGNNTVLTSGLINYIADYIASRTIVKYDEYKERLTNISNQLAVKLGGFAEKSKLKLVLDSRSPLNKSSVFVPDENYQIVMNKSSALETATLSGVIIEKTVNGYIISGYDKEYPVFKFNKVNPRAQDPGFTVGGISESFVEWSRGQQYTIGTVVVYENVYYRTKATHTSSDSFDSTKFAKLAALPIVGGVGAQYRKSFETEISYYPYGTLLTSEQDVIDFLFGYENYLKNLGFEFEYVNSDTGVLENMLLCAKEFLFWVTQNWDNGTIITISPIANECKFSRNFYTVDDIYDEFYDYNILTGDGTRLAREFTNTYRDNNNLFGIKPVEVNDGIYLIKLPLIQIEHIVLIDNETEFADVIYDIQPGYRQERIKLVGYRTDNWNGGLNIPGFIYNEAKVKIWNTYTDYAIGDLVKYKEFYYSANIAHTSTQYFDANYWNILSEKPKSELLPNWDYRVNQFTDFYDLDTDNFDTEQQRLGQHLIGYQKREYLANIITDDVSQYKFYQGFIQDKGTKNSLTKLFGALSSANQDSLEFYEEWALRLGQYGAIDNLKEIEYQLKEDKFRLNPQIIELVNSESSTRNDLVYEIPSYNVYAKPVDYDHQNLFDTVYNTNTFTKDSGYVRDEDVKLIVEDYDSFANVNIDELLIGDFVWLTKYKQTWTVVRHVDTDYQIIDFNSALPAGRNLNANNEVVNGFTVYLDSYHDIQPGETIGFKCRSVPELNGFWKVLDAYTNTICLESPEILNINREDLDSTSTNITRFVERRFSNVDAVNTGIENLLDDREDRVWIDDTGSGTFGVYENDSIFALQEEVLNPTSDGDGFATAFDADSSNTTIAISTPYSKGWDRDETVRIYKRPVDNYTLTLAQSLYAGDYIGVLDFQVADVDTATDEITIENHGLVSGNRITYSSPEGYELGGLTQGGKYFVDVVDENTIRLATDKTLSTIIDITSAILGTHTLTVIDNLFGTDVSISSNGQYLAVGIPNAGNLLTNYVGELQPGILINKDDIVSDRGTLWRALRDITTWEDSTGDSSTISATDQDWEPVYLISGSDTGVRSRIARQGAVNLYKRQLDGTYALELTISSPDPREYEYFGYSVELRTDANGVNKLFVGAPGIDNVDVGRIYFLDDSLGEWTYSRDRSYKGIYDYAKRYLKDEIVYHNGYQYIALVNVAPGSYVPGAIGSENIWTLVSDSDDNLSQQMVEHTGYVPHNVRNESGYIDDNPLAEDTEAGLFDTALNIGKTFDVNNLGDILVMASDYSDAERKVSVFRNNVNRWKFSQRIVQTTTTRDDFGAAIAINDTGDQIAIGSPFADTYGVDEGYVEIYNSATTTFELSQTLRSPFREKNEVFGNGIDFSSNKIAISGKNTDRKIVTTFDIHAETLPSVRVEINTDGSDVYTKYVLDPSSPETDKNTTFDGNATKFVTVTKDTGRIALFQQIGSNYIFAEDVAYNRNTKYTNIENFKLNYNHVYIGLPKMNPAAFEDSTLALGYEVTSTDSTLGVFADLASTRNSNTWATLTEQSGKPNLNKINRSFLYSKTNDDLLTTLDIIDPRQGKIAGPAEQQIDYKTFYDPAIYSNNLRDNRGRFLDNVVVDPENNWTEKHVGKIWWDISTASWYNPYQSNTQYRTAYWNKLIPGASIDVYEWVGTTYTPSSWARYADTKDGYARGISGTPLYDDNVYSSKRMFDPTTGGYVTKYFYWVKNKKILPNLANRSLTANEIAQLIATPNTSSYRFIAPLDTNSFAIYNSKSLIEGTNTILHYAMSIDENLETNIHSEYQLLTEGLGTSVVNSEIENKWFDSLIGYDINNKEVPDASLPTKQKYGILNIPRQSMFINRLEAVKQFVERVNSVLIQNQIVDNYVLDEFLSAEEAPSEYLGKYDSVVDDLTALNFIIPSRKRQAVLTPVITNGRITGVEIVDAGNGYENAPNVIITDIYGKGAIVYTTINSQGQITGTTLRSSGKNYSTSTTFTVRPYSILVNVDSEIGGRWAIYEWNKSQNVWQRKENQSYDTTRYWDYSDWYATDYNESTKVDFVVDQSYELFGLSDAIGNIVKIDTVGTGGWLLLKKVDDQVTEDYTINYETIGRENGTIQLSTRLYDYATQTSGYDAQIYDTAFYDREPVYELRNILHGLKNNIFINELATEYNNLFFASLRYVFHEQQTVDWAFKTSFVRAKHNLGGLVQKPTFQNDNLDNYEDYVNEVKPFKTKVREYISSYNETEPTQTLTTDFDLPPSYNPTTKEIEISPAKHYDNAVTNILDRYLEYPYKSWVDNNGYEVTEIAIADGGSGYTTTPVVTVDGDNGTTAKAYLSKGVVSYIEVTNKGGKYYKAPTVTIEGSLADGGTAARAVAILGNGVVRKSHITVKFDRVTGTYVYTDLLPNELGYEQFAGTGSKTKFTLTWPMNITRNTFTIVVDGITLLSSEYTVGNDVDTTDTEYRTSNRYFGYVSFTTAPASGADIKIYYKKDIKLLNVADRINFFYNPTTGMTGKYLNQLMDGVEYEGSIYDSIDFGTSQGFGVGFGSTPFDTFDNTFQDEIFTLGDSTTSFTLSEALANGVEYNVYLISYPDAYPLEDAVIYRLDDPDYGSSIDNEYAIMLPITGDGTTTTVTVDINSIPGYDLSWSFKTNPDQLVIRKSTSDGSLTPVATSYDTSLSGGNFTYTTATGLASEDITIDGDGFVTPTTSKGPEEIVPGQLFDTLDIKVYHRNTDGVGMVGIASYIVDPTTTTYALPNIPQSNDGVIVKLDGVILDPASYSVDWKNQLVEFEDSSSGGGNLTITTIGTNGVDLIDTDYTTYDGSSNSIITAAKYNETVSTFVTVNGRVLQNQVDYTLSESTDDDLYPQRVKITIESSALTEGDFIQYSTYDSEIQSYSQIIVDKTFESNGENNYHVFDTDVGIPFNSRPWSHNILVKSGNLILTPGYHIRYTTTLERTYDIDAWQFVDPTIISEAEVLVYADNVRLNKTQYTFDPVNTRITLLRNDIAPLGTQLDIYVIKNADYYFVDTQIEFESIDSGVLNVEEFVSVGDTVQLQANAADSTIYTVTVKSITGNTMVVEQYREDVRDAFVADPEFIISVLDGDSTLLKIAEVTYVESDSVTFNVPPSSGDIIEFYIFSNHDINDFNRMNYNVITTTSVLDGSNDFVKRNLLTRGIITLEEPVMDTRYVWVAHNKVLLTPFVDYKVSNGQLKLNVIPEENDSIDVIQFGNTPVSPKYGFRIFKDMLNRTHYKRLNETNSYVLSNDLNYYDARIVLDDATGIFQPNRSKNIPGVIFIEGERIEYFEVVGNALLQLRRGTLGTGVRNTYSAGTRAYGQGPEETINYQDRVIKQTVTADGTSSEYTLDFDALTEAEKYITNSTRTDLDVNDVANSLIEVSVGGIRLRRTAIQKYIPTVAQDSPEADITVEKEYRIDGTNIFIEPRNPLTNEIILPENWDGQNIDIVRTVGQTWNENGKTLADSNNDISKFLRAATIRLPK